MMIQHCWDVLELMLSTDFEGDACVKVLYDKSELTVGCNILRERRFNREAFSFPEVIVLGTTDLELTFRIYYEGEEELGLEFRLHLDDTPAIEIRIGTEERPARLGLRLLAVDEQPDLDEDDGRYDAWA